VNAKIISQLNNDRIDTTQGIDMTKKLTATELTNAMNATTPNPLSHLVHQPARVVVDNQAICSGIASTKACSFTINKLANSCRVNVELLFGLFTDSFLYEFDIKKIYAICL
jgi:hypothetical protein